MKPGTDVLLAGPASLFTCLSGSRTFTFDADVLEDAFQNSIRRRSSSATVNPAARSIF